LFYAQPAVDSSQVIFCFHCSIFSLIPHFFRSSVEQSCQIIINFAQTRGLPNEKISFVIVSRPFPTMYRHVSPVQNVFVYAEEDPITLKMDPKMYYTLVP